MDLLSNAINAIVMAAVGLTLWLLTRVALAVGAAPRADTGG